MKKILLTLSLILLAFTLCNSQTIETKKVFGGYKYSQNGQDLSMDELSTQLNTNEESAQLMKKAKSQSTIASILSGAGGALVGYPVGTAIGGGEANWVLAGVGAGIIAVALPLSASANKKAKHAVEIYNTGNKTKEDNVVYIPKLFVVSNPSGMGLALMF